LTHFVFSTILSILFDDINGIETEYNENKDPKSVTVLGFF